MEPERAGQSMPLSFPPFSHLYSFGFKDSEVMTANGFVMEQPH